MVKTRPARCQLQLCTSGSWGNTVLGQGDLSLYTCSRAHYRGLKHRTLWGRRVLGAKWIKFHKNYGSRLVLEKSNIGSFKWGLCYCLPSLKGFIRVEAVQGEVQWPRAGRSQWVGLSRNCGGLNSRGISTKCSWKKNQIKHLLMDYTESFIALRLTSCRKGISFKLGISSCLSFTCELLSSAL